MKEQTKVESITIAVIYIVILALFGFAFVWFFLIKPPRSIEEFLFMWLIFFIVGTGVYHLMARQS